MEAGRSCTAFRGTTRIASGALAEVALKAKAVIDADQAAPILIFDDRTSELVEVDFRGTPEDVLKRLGVPNPEAEAGALAQAALYAAGLNVRANASSLQHPAAGYPWLDELEQLRSMGYAAAERLKAARTERAGSTSR